MNLLIATASLVICLGIAFVIYAAFYVGAEYERRVNLTDDPERQVSHAENFPLPAIDVSKHGGGSGL